MQEAGQHDARLQELQAALATKDQEIAAVEADAAGAQQAVADLQAELDGAGGETMKAKRDAVADVKQVRPVAGLVAASSNHSLHFMIRWCKSQALELALQARSSDSPQRCFAGHLAMRPPPLQTLPFSAVS